MRRGFTLLELILVIAIIVVLAGAMIPVFNVTRREAQEAKAIAELDSIKTAALMYRADTNAWPPTGTAGSGLINNNSIASWNGPYLTQWKNDPWNTPYRIATCYTTGLCVSSNNSTSGPTDDIEMIITSNTTNP